MDLDALQPWEAALRPPSPSFAAASSAAFAEATAAEFGFSPPESPLVRDPVQCSQCRPRAPQNSAAICLIANRNNMDSGGR